MIWAVLMMVSCEKEPATQNQNNGSGYTYPPVYYAAIMYTPFSNDWDYWRFEYGDTLGTFSTAFSEDWDYFNFGIAGVNGTVKTVFSEDWDYWRLTSASYDINIKTSFSEDYDSWDVDDLNSSWHLDVQTSFSDDFDNWDVYQGNHLLDIYTSFSEDWDSWRVTGEFPMNYPMEYRIAAVCVPVLVAVMKQNGLIP